jgi:hypothetical protein
VTTAIGLPGSCAVAGATRLVARANGTSGSSDRLAARLELKLISGSGSAAEEASPLPEDDRLTSIVSAAAPVSSKLEWLAFRKQL